MKKCIKCGQVYNDVITACNCGEQLINATKKISSKQLGDVLFQWCLQVYTDFLEDYKHQHNKYSGIVHPSLADINTKELLVGVMWSVWHALQSEKYISALYMMHEMHIKYYGLSDEEADEEMKLLELRYEEYRQAVSDDSRRRSNPNFFPVYPGAIAYNIFDQKEGVHNGRFGIYPGVTFNLMLHITLSNSIKYLVDKMREYEMSSGGHHTE